MSAVGIVTAGLFFFVLIKVSVCLAAIVFYAGILFGSMTCGVLRTWTTRGWRDLAARGRAVEFRVQASRYFLVWSEHSGENYFIDLGDERTLVLTRADNFVKDFDEPAFGEFLFSDLTVTHFYNSNNELKVQRLQGRGNVLEEVAVLEDQDSHLETFYNSLEVIPKSLDALLAEAMAGMANQATES